MVYPVQVVSGVSRTRRENGSSRRQQPGPSKAVAFAAVLEKVVTEDQPIDCYTVTYNANRELQTYSYLPSREYTL